MAITKKVGDKEVKLAPTTDSAVASPLLSKLDEHLEQGTKKPVKAAQPSNAAGDTLPPAHKIFESQAHATSQVSGKSGALEHSEHEVLATVKSTEPLCNVGTSAKFTKNLGNYQSATLSVSLNVPCPLADIDATFDFAREWVDNKLAVLVAELDES